MRNWAVQEKIEVKRLAQILVRESGYNAAMSKHAKDEAYSRATGIYDYACALLRVVDPEDAEAFIKSTWFGGEGGERKC